MRTALLSAIETTDEGATRAFLQMGGRNLIDWQLDLARDLGCERVICIASGPSAQLGGLRLRAEQSGLEFHAISGPLQLVGQVSADQELVVLGDGVILDREFLAENFADGRAVAVVPADPGISFGFERIDAQNAWAGLFITRANIAERLAEMPADSDTISLLLRLALQAGTRLVPIDAERLADGTLLLATNNQIVAEREHILLNRSTQRKSWYGPGNALAQISARQLASNWLSRAPLIGAVAGCVLVAAAIGLAVLLKPIWGLIALVMGAFASSLSVSLYNLKAKLLGSDQPRSLALFFNLLIDLSIIVVLVYPISQGWRFRLFLAVILIGAWRLSELMSKEELAAFWQDRSLLIGLLLAASFWGLAPLVVQLLILVALGYCLIRAGREKITRA